MQLRQLPPPRTPPTRGHKRAGDGEEEQATPPKRPCHGATPPTPAEAPPAEILHRIAGASVRNHGYRKSGPSKLQVRQAARHYKGMGLVNRHWHRAMVLMFERAWHTYLAVHIETGRPALWGIFPRVPPMVFTTVLDPDSAPPIFAPIVQAPGIEDLAARVDGLVIEAFRHEALTLSVLDPLLRQVERLLGRAKLPRTEAERLIGLPHTVLAVACLFGSQDKAALFEQILNLLIEHMALRPEQERIRLLGELQLVTRPQHWHQIQDRLLGGEASAQLDLSRGTESPPTLTPQELAQKNIDCLQHMALPLSPRSIARIRALAALWVKQGWTRAQQAPLLDSIGTLVSQLLKQLVHGMGPDGVFTATYVFEAFCPELMADAMSKLAPKQRLRLLQGIDVSPNALACVAAHVRNLEHPLQERRQLLGELIAVTSRPEVLQALQALWRELFPRPAF